MAYYALCWLLPCAQVTSRLPQWRCRHTGQISWGNSSRLPRAIAGSTLPVLDEYGLRNAELARPTLAPHIRFLFIDSRFCSTLLSDPASRRRPCVSQPLPLNRLGKKFFPPRLRDIPSTLGRAPTQGDALWCMSGV